MTDRPTSLNDKPVGNQEAPAWPHSTEVQNGTPPTSGQASNDAHVASGTLPSLSIDGADKSNTGWGPGAMAVAGDLLKGVNNEVVNHTRDVVGSGAFGAVVGAAAAPIAEGLVGVAAAVGVTVTAPEVLLGAAGAGIAYSAYELYEHVGGWLNAAKIVSDQKDYSTAQVDQAHTDLQDVGAGGVNIAAGLLGGYAGSYLAGPSAAAGADVPKGSTNLDTPPAVATPLDAPATPAPTGSTPPADAPATPAPTGSTPPVDAPATPAPATPAQPSTTPPADAPATPAQPQTTPQGDAGPEKPVAGDAQPAEVAAVVDLDNPAANTNEATLGKALQDAIQTAKANGQPITFKVDNTVQLTDAAGNPVKTTQAQVLYQELKAAYPENQFVFSKPNLNPGDVGYTESPAFPVTQDGLHISTKENGITLATETSLPDGTTLPAGTKFAVGTTYDGSVVKSALPDGKVWATKPDGSYIQVAGEGESTAIPKDAFSTQLDEIGQVRNIKTDEGVPNNILVRTDAKTVAPDGKPLLDAFPIDDNTLNAVYKGGTQPGYYAPVGKSADHFKLPSNMTIVTQMDKDSVTASGADRYYFMKSGYGDAPEATAKNYSAPPADPQSAAELARLRTAEGY